MGPVLAIIAGLIGLNLLIILHELGHFIVAKRNGVEVEEFGLGLPPRLASRTMGRGFWRCRYSLNWLPIGGFVRLKGEDINSDEPGSFRAASLKVRLKILLAGVWVNFLIGAILLMILAVIGLPRLLPAEPFFPDRQQWSLAADTYVSEHNVHLDFVAADSAAEAVGLRIGDRLLAIDNRPIASLDHLRVELEANVGQEVELTSESTTFSFEPGSLSTDPNDGSQPQLGARELVFEVHGWSAPITGVALAVQYTQLMLEGMAQALGLLIAGSPGEASNLVSGPVGILHVIQLASGQSWKLVLMIIATISLSLAVMNLLPIPALDGGQALLFVWSEKIRRKPLTPAFEKRLQLLSFVFLLTLVAVLTLLVDIPRLF